MRGAPADREVRDAGVSAAGAGDSPFYKMKPHSIVVDAEIDHGHEKTAF